MKLGICSLIILLTMVPGAVSAQTVTPVDTVAWYQCTRATDCVVANGVCNENTVVNRQYVNQYAGYVAAMANVPCPIYLSRMRDITPTCYNNFCVLGQ